MESHDAVAQRIAAAERARAQLIAGGFARLASSSEQDAGYFVAAEVAAVLEHRRQVLLDPATFTTSDLDRWRAEEPLALADLEPSPRPGALVLIEHGAPIGTICFDDFEGLSRYAQVSSLYVAPAWRARGVASCLLDALRATLMPTYDGVALTTYWTWQRAVRFYLRHGATVRQWKHALVFLWRGPETRWDAQFASDTATFTWLRSGSAPQRWAARRTGTWLVLNEPEHQREDRYNADWRDALMTFSVLLASRGWPIVRSAQTLEAGADWTDGGYPEGLARNIERWEALDRERGFVVDAPRLPILRYRSSDELRED